MLFSLLVIIFSSIEFIKVIIANDAEAMKKAQSKLIYRIVAIVLLLLLPLVTNIVIGLVISGDITDFTCGLR